METTVREALKDMETESDRIKSITDPLQEASTNFYNLMEDMIKRGKDIRKAHVYCIALHEIISYLFDLREASVARSIKGIKGEVAKTTKAITIIRSWRRGA